MLVATKAGGYSLSLPPMEAETSPILVRINGTFEAAIDSDLLPENEAVYFWRFVTADEETASSKYFLFRDIDTACKYFEAVYAILPAMELKSWTLVRTVLPSTLPIYSIGKETPRSEEGTEFISTLTKMGLFDFYLSDTVAVANIGDWNPATMNTNTTVWPLDASLLTGFLFTAPDGTPRLIESGGRHWSWRRRGEATILPSDVDRVRQLELHKPILKRQPKILSTPYLPSPGIVLVERYYYELHPVGGQIGLKLNEFPADSASRPKPAEVEAWYQNFDATGRSKNSVYQMTLVTMALIFGDPLGGAWFMIMPVTVRDVVIAAPPLPSSSLIRFFTGSVEVLPNPAAKVLMAAGYVHAFAPMFRDWDAEPSRSHVFALVRETSEGRALQVEFPYFRRGAQINYNNLWWANVIRLIIAQSIPTPASADITDPPTGPGVLLQALPPYFKSVDGWRWEAGTEEPANIVARAYLNFIKASGGGGPSLEAVRKFINSGMAEVELLSFPHLDRSVFFQYATWRHLTRDHPAESIAPLLETRYPSMARSAEPSVSSFVDYKIMDTLDSLLSRISPTLHQLTTAVNGNVEDWTMVLDRDVTLTDGASWFGQVLAGTYDKTTSVERVTGHGAFGYSLVGSLFLETDFLTEKNRAVFEQIHKSPILRTFFDQLNAFLGDINIFPARTPWFLRFPEIEQRDPSNVRIKPKSLDLIRVSHRALLHPFMAIFHRALASGDEKILARLLEWMTDNPEKANLNLKGDGNTPIYENLFVAFLSGQARNFPDPRTFHREILKSSVAGMFIDETKGNISDAESHPPLRPPSLWAIYEIARIGNRPLLKQALNSLDRRTLRDAAQIGYLTDDVPNVPRLLDLTEHISLLAERDSGLVAEKLEYAEMRSRLGPVQEIEGRGKRNPRRFDEPQLASQMILSRQSRQSEWNPKSDYEIKVGRSGISNFLEIAAHNFLKNPPPLDAKPGSSSLSMTQILAACGRTLLHGTQTRAMPDPILLAAGFWRTFVNHLLRLKEIDRRADTYTPAAPSLEEFASAIAIEEVEPLPLVVPDDDDDPFSVYHKTGDYPLAGAPPPAAAPHPAATQMDREAQAFIDTMRREITSRKSKEPLPIYTITQGATLESPPLPTGFWLAPFYASDIEDRRIDDLLREQHRVIHPRIEALTASVASMAGLFASFGILARRIGQAVNKSPGMEQYFGFYDPATPRMSAIWSDLSTGLALIDHRSQLYLMYESMARERRFLQMQSPTVSKRLITPVLEDLLQKTQTQNRSALPVAQSVRDAIQATERRSGYDKFRPTLLSGPRLGAAKSLSVDDSDRPLIMNTVHFERQIKRASETLGSKSKASQSARFAAAESGIELRRRQIRRLAGGAFPAIDGEVSNIATAIFRTVPDLGENYIPKVHEVQIDREIRAAIEAEMRDHGADPLLLLLINEAQTYGVMRTFRDFVAGIVNRFTKTPGVSYPPELSVDAVDNLAVWLTNAKNNARERFAYDGIISSTMFDDLSLPKHMTIYQTYYALFGPIRI